MDKEYLLNIVNYRTESAFNTINEAESHINNGYLNTAMNRIYYAGFYVVSALALLDGFSTSKHKQLIGYFNKNYVKTGIINREIAGIFTIAYERREAADYHDFVYLTRTQIDEYRISMVEFIKQIDLIIREKIENL